MIENKQEFLIRVVDDEEELRKSYKFMIEDEGWTVKTYPDADSFLNEDDPNVPGCLVLDVRMPDMTGIQLQREMMMRENHIPIIFVTGHGDVDMAVKALHNGAVDFLQKPPEPERLLAMIEKAALGDVRNRAERKEVTKLRAVFERLTPREKMIARKISHGLLNKQIAFELEISEKTVQVHRGSLCRKLEARNAADVTKILMKINEH